MMNLTGIRRSDKVLRLIRLLFLCGVMFLTASMDGLIGVLVPSLKNEFQVSDTQISYLLVLNSIGFMMFTYIGGKICEKRGHRPAFFISISMIAAGCLMMLTARQFAVIAAVSFWINCAISFATISANSSVSILYTASRALYMNFFHLIYAVSGAGTKMVTGLVVTADTDWRTVYACIGFIALLPLCLLAKLSFHRTGEKTRKEYASLTSLFRNPMMIPFILMTGGLSSAVTGTNMWFVNYAHFTYGLSVDKATGYLSMFFLFTAAGMLLFMGLIRRVGEKRLLAAFSFAAASVYLLGIFLGEKGFMLIASSGLFFSILYPTMLASVSRYFPGGTAQAMGIIVTVGSLLNLLFGALIGRLNDCIGIGRAYWFIPFGVILFMVFTVWRTDGKAAPGEK